MTTTLHLEWIESQQRRLLSILDGLDEDQLRTPALPSGWTPLGLLAHVAEASRFWCLQVMLGQHAEDPAADGEPDDTESLEEPFLAPLDVSAAAAVEAFRATTLEALDGVRALALDTPPAWWPDGAWGGWRLDSLNEVLLHLLVETACHAGHLDAARELIDGATFDYATDRPRRR